MSSEKMYYYRPYEKEFDAEVNEVKENRVVLDRTLFYPTGGGQICDTGYLGEIKVTKVEEENGKILHFLEENIFKPGDKVHGKIDWEKRYKLMKLHSAVHIVYFMFAKIYGEKEVIGSNITQNKGRIDFALNENINKNLTEIENMTNQFIAEAHKIETYEDSESNKLRIWECAGNKMPCGGTHVKNTEEIKEVRLKRKNIGGGKERIEVKIVE